MAQQPLIDQALLEKLERLTLHWQKSFPGLVGGRNASRFSGPGQEFLDHRHFHHGDDFRAVNWRAFLGLRSFCLKLFQVEPRIPVRILIDSSESMGTGEVPKFDYARKLAAALTYVGLVRLDTVCLQAFSDSLGRVMQLRRRASPVSSRGSFSKRSATERIEQFPAGGAAVLLELSAAWASRHRVGLPR